MNTSTLCPAGFYSYVTNAGIKDTSKDVVVIYSHEQCAIAGMYTLNRFAGPAVKLSRAQLMNKRARALVVISKNANVANGSQGYADALRIVRHVANELGIDESEVQIAGTGVIGRPLPVDSVVKALHGLSGKLRYPADFQEAAHGIMTTDTHAKLVSAKIGNCTITGIAKGVGMIEPNMATLLVYFFTDAKIEQKNLQAIFEDVIGKTFNCISIDTDTSTSDSAVIFANGLAGQVDEDEFSSVLHKLAFNLMKMVLDDGEGVTKIIQTEVINALDYAQAKTIAKAVINSPLVKTAVHGCDPNWGRIAMAVGKCSQYADIDADRTNISIGNISVYPESAYDANDKVKTYMKFNDEIKIVIDLNIGQSSAVVWGCDLSSDYVQFNSAYTS